MIAKYAYLAITLIAAIAIWYSFRLINKRRKTKNWDAPGGTIMKE